MEDIRQKIAEIITLTHKMPLEQADEILLLLGVVGRSEQFYCKKGTCKEDDQCNHCWNIENPPEVIEQ